MGLEFALDELYASGWTALDTAGCNHCADGRAYPGVERIRREFLVSGYEFTVNRVDRFGCFRAEWRGPGEEPGSAVGTTEDEAAVYALAQMRRQSMVAQAV